MLLLSFLVFLVNFALVLAIEYYGVSLGSFESPSVQGDVYMINSSHIQILDYTAAPQDLFVTLNGNRRSITKVYQYIESPGGDWLKNDGSLRNEFQNSVRLVVGMEGSAAQWKQFAVIDRNGKILASVEMNKTPPQPFCCFEMESDMGLFGKHGIISDPIEVLDSKTLKIPSFSYRASETPDGYFFAGSGPDINQKTGKKAFIVGKDTENRICPMLTNIADKDMIIRLGDDQTIYDIEWLSIFCYQYSHDFGHLDLGLVEDEDYVPPFIPQIHEFAPQKLIPQSC